MHCIHFHTCLLFVEGCRSFHWLASVGTDSRDSASSLVPTSGTVAHYPAFHLPFFQVVLHGLANHHTVQSSERWPRHFQPEYCAPETLVQHIFLSHLKTPLPFAQTSLLGVQSKAGVL